MEIPRSPSYYLYVDGINPAPLVKDFFHQPYCYFSPQVSKVEKKKVPKEKSEKVEAQTFKEKTKALLPDFLKAAGQARASRLNLAGLSYTEELQKTLQNHSTKMEEEFTKVKGAVDSSSEKTCEVYFKSLEDDLKTHQKLQVGLEFYLTSSSFQTQQS